MFFVYILQSEKTGRYYIGQTNNPDQRLRYHNSGRVSSTKSGRPWKIIIIEEYYSRVEAMKREKYLKSQKGGVIFKKIIEQR